MFRFFGKILKMSIKQLPAPKLLAYYKLQQNSYEYAYNLLFIRIRPERNNNAT